MFASTAYEAFYTIIGLYLHEASISIITSRAILAGVLALIFGATFFFAIWGYFKKFLPGFLGGGNGVNLGIFVKLVASFFLGISILQVSSFSDVRDYNRVSWQGNDYIESKIPNLEKTYKVSLVFDFLTRSAEEISFFMSNIVDNLFERTNSQLHAPASFYKAIIYAGSVSIEDGRFRSLIDLYSSECFSQVIPQLQTAQRTDKISEFFRLGGIVDQSLREIVLTTNRGEKVTCLDLKEKVHNELYNYAISVEGNIVSYYKNNYPAISTHKFHNNIMSSILNNYFKEKTESYWLGIQKGAELPQDGFARFLIGWKRFFSYNGILNFFGGGELEGSSLSAERALQFNEYLKRAPHIKGMVKLFLIAIFPWLIFFVFAGKWKIIISWWAVYTSVLMWTPLWTILYHLMTSMALSTEVMEAFGNLNDGISLYSSELINNKIYQFYAIYAWLQLVIGPLPTIILAWGMFTGFLSDSRQESAPEGVGAAASVTGAVATGGASGGVSTALEGGIKTAARKAGYKPVVPKH